MTYELLANRATGGLIGGYRCMDQGEKMDCGANGEVTFCAMSLLLSQSPKISDWVSQRMETPLQVRNSELS
jgi:hypothetical protein